MNDFKARHYIKTYCSHFGSIRDAAKDVGMDHAHLWRVIHGKKTLTPEIAAKFGLIGEMTWKLK